MDNIKMLLQGLIDNDLIKPEVRDFILWFLTKNNLAEDISAKCIPLMMDSFARLDLDLFINDDGLSGAFKDKAPRFLADACFFGALKDCFTQEDITRLFFLYQLLHDHVVARDSLVFKN